MTAGTAIATGLVLGLSSGPQCFWSCASVLGPFMVVTAPDVAPLSKPRWSTLPASLRVLAWYNLGRLLAYLATGLFVGLLARSGALLPPWLHATALIATTLLLAVALLRPTNEKRCWKPRQRSGSAVVIGVLQGLAPCPPFITAIALALGSPSMLSGLLLFGALFLGTALFTLPLAFIEPLRKRRWLTQLVRVVGAAVCVYLLLSAVALLVRGAPVV